jgi:hypothetical protein
VAARGPKIGVGHGICRAEPAATKGWAVIVFGILVESNNLSRFHYLHHFRCNFAGPHSAKACPEFPIETGFGLCYFLTAQ